MRTKFLWALIAVVVVALSATGLAATTDVNTFVFTTIAGADSLDPAYCYDNASASVIQQCYDSLIAYKHTGESWDLGQFVPMIAMEVPTEANGGISKDGRTIKFRIRPGVPFHSGGVVYPEDVKYSFERAMLADPAGGPNWMFFEPLTGYSTMAQIVTSVGGPEQIDDMTKVDPAVLRKAFDVIDKTIEVQGNNVIFHLPKAYPPFLNILCHGASWGSIISKDYMIEHGAWDGKPDDWANWYDQPKEDMTLYETECGTGPFILKTWDKSGGQLIFKRFNMYWQGPANFETLVIKYVDEQATRILMLKNGDADAAYVEPAYLEQVQGVPGIVVKTKLPAIANTTLLFNWTIPVEGNEAIVGSGKLDGKGIPSDFFADVNIRRAFCEAFDYDSYLKDATMGLSTKPYGPAPAILPFVDKTQPWYSMDLDAAKADFQKAFGGQVWDKGFKLTLLYNTGNNVRKTACEILEANIESLNPKFQVDVQSMDWPTYLTKLRATQLPVFFMGWLMDFPDVHNFYQPYMSSSGAFAGYCGQALIDWAKAHYDDLISQGISETDPVKRAQIYSQLQKMAKDDAVAMFYDDNTGTRVYRDWVKGFSYCPAFSSAYDYYSLSKVNE